MLVPSSEDSGGRFRRNVGNPLAYHTASHRRSQTSCVYASFVPSLLHVLPIARVKPSRTQLHDRNSALRFRSQSERTMGRQGDRVSGLTLTGARYREQANVQHARTTSGLDRRSTSRGAPFRPYSARLSSVPTGST
jgi:hypothetical protein